MRVSPNRRTFKESRRKLKTVVENVSKIIENERKSPKTKESLRKRKKVFKNQSRSSNTTEHVVLSRRTRFHVARSACSVKTRIRKSLVINKKDAFSRRSLRSLRENAYKKVFSNEQNGRVFASLAPLALRRRV